MKTLKQTDLPGLPPEVRALVADGVYSLYELAYETQRYILLTSKGAECQAPRKLTPSRH